VLLALATGACILVQDPSRGPGTPPPGPAPSPRPRAERAASVVRAKELRARTVRARTIHAKEVHAREVRAGRVVRDERDAWEQGRSDEEVKAVHVVADVVYAKEIFADLVEAEVLYVKELKEGGR